MVSASRRSYGDLPIDGLSVSRVYQEKVHDLERVRLARETDVLRQQALQQRHKAEVAASKLRADLQDHMSAARECAFALDQQTRHEHEFLRRARADLASERASFNSEMRRRESVFTQYEKE